MDDVCAEALPNIIADMNRPTVLYASGDHRVFWLGIAEETAFRCNTYLLCDGDEAILFDPGNARFFDEVRERVEQVLPPERVSGMVLSHQDPDVAASMVQWLDVNPSMRVFASSRTNVLLPHYGRDDYRFHDASEQPEFALPSGAKLRFIAAPFLHFPGAVGTYDTASGYLFSGDVWASLDLDWTLTVQSFEEHAPKMDLFHVDYMASNIAARGFARRLQDIDIAAILPQHGSIIGPDHVSQALNYLEQLRCGTDIIYAQLGR